MMTKLTMAEAICSVFVLIILVSQFVEKMKTVSGRRLRLCTTSVVLWLLIDATSYIFNGPGYPYAFLFTINLLSFVSGCFVFIGFIWYCDAYINEITPLDHRLFYAPMFLLCCNAINIGINFALGIGGMFSYENGFVTTNSMPVWCTIPFFAILVYMPIIFLLRADVYGWKPPLFLGIFCMAPFIGLISSFYVENDYTVVLSSIALVIVITFLQNMERNNKLEAARQSAEAASKAKTTFLFNMSHDIRTPMNAILGFADIALRHSDDSDRVNDCVSKIKLSGGHLLSLINDILEMSRIEAGKLELIEGPLDIREAVSNVNQMSQSLAVPKSIELETVCGNIEHPYIMADELHVNEVLINIISNAVKYTQEGGKVEYRTEETGLIDQDHVNIRFTVTDNGIGMSEEFQKHLFEDFSRENSSTVSKQEGAGLGLAIVHKIVTLAHGTITVHSVKGEGSTFIIDIPMKIMDEETKAKFLEDNKKYTVITEDKVIKGRKVLLVEDNEMNREIATDVLTETGLDVDTAEDGDIAVKRVTEKGTDYYDFILMDIQMPVMDGYEATAHIRQLPGGSNVKIIALSANAFKEDMEKSLAAGMNAHVAKPFDVNTLMNTMHRLSED